MEYDPDDHWDATSWYGYDDTEKKNVEKLIIGRLKSGTFEAFSYSGEYGKDNIWPSNWEEYAHHDIGRSKTFSLKLIQASIEGYAADNTSGYKASSNPLIFSYCTYDGKGTGEHFLKKFYPGSNSFATDAPIYTDLPYGYTVVATAADPTTETAPGGGLYYKQYTTCCEVTRLHTIGTSTPTSPPSAPTRSWRDAVPSTTRRPCSATASYAISCASSASSKDHLQR